MGQFKIAKLPGLDCINACLVNILYNTVSEYEWAFYNSFDFRFLPGSITLGGSISAGEIDIIENCRKIFNLYLYTPNIVFDLKQIKKYEQKEHEYYFVKINPEHAYWLKKYQLHDSPHIIIIVKRESDRFLCADPQFMNDLFIIKEDWLTRVYDGHLIAGRDTKAAIEPHSILLQKFYEHMNHIRIKDNYIAFLNYFNSINLASGRYVDEKIFIAKFEYLIAYKIPGMRYLFNLLLKRLVKWEYVNSSYNVQELLQNSLTEWEVVKGIVQKILLSGSYPQDIKQKLLQRLRKISYYENALQDIFIAI